jgi:hypothetical protein
VNFATVTLFVASQRVVVVVVVVVYFVMTQSGNFWIHPYACTHGNRIATVSGARSRFTRQNINVQPKTQQYFEIGVFLTMASV